MNRRQKVAFVVGALVIAALALFPPWSSKGVDGNLPTRFRWFASSPAILVSGVLPAPERVVIEPLHVAGKGIERPGVVGPFEDEALLTGRVDYQIGLVRHEIGWRAMASLQPATIALSVAAVVVLRGRKAGSEVR